MAQDYARAFYNSGDWDRVRKAYARSRGGLCELCLAKGIVRAGTVVHHRIPITPENIRNPAVTMNFDNLELVCADCHAMEHRHGRRYSIGADGTVRAVER